MTKLKLVFFILCVITIIQSCIKKDVLPPQYTGISVVNAVPDSILNLKIDDLERLEKVPYLSSTGYLAIDEGFKSFQAFGTPGGSFITPRTVFTGSIVNPVTFYSYRTAAGGLAVTRYVDTLSTAPTKTDSAGIRIFHGLRNLGNLDFDTSNSPGLVANFSNTSYLSLTNQIYANNGGTASVVNRFAPVKSGNYNFYFRRNNIAPPAGIVKGINFTIQKGKLYTFVISGDTAIATYKPTRISVFKHN